MSHMTKRLANDVYFIFSGDEVVDWTEDINEARRWERRTEYTYRRYSINPMNRLPHELHTNKEHRSLEEYADQ